LNGASCKSISLRCTSQGQAVQTKIRFYFASKPVIISIVFSQIPPTWIAAAIEQACVSSLWGRSFFLLRCRNVGPFATSNRYQAENHTYTLYMNEEAKLAALPLLGDADPLPASLFASFPEQANTLALLYEVSREITSILDREELLRRIAERVKKLVNYQVFSVMLWNERTQHLESVFGMRFDDTIPSRMRLPLHQGITGASAGERRAIRVSDTLNDPRFITCELGVVVRSELVVPLLLGDKLIGVLDLESTQANAFTAEHERMLVTLGSYIAIALENARLYEESRETERRLQADLFTAREIQRGLLPTGAREVPGLDLAAAYVPARELGGDFYDFLPYGKGRLAMVVGDVSGKGTAAALFASLAIGIMREHVVEHPCPPAEMLAMLNTRLHSARLDSRFIATLFSIYDAGERRLTLSNAGGPYPLLVRDGAVQSIRVAGIPLGLFPDTQYEQISVDLVPGDTVLFASDGILESSNADLEEFGPDRLCSLLGEVSPQQSAEEVAAAILAATDSYSGIGVPPFDDRTLLVLRVTGHSTTDFSKLPIIY
jgi:phosphoserine phosphatase RsbU/P